MKKLFIVANWKANIAVSQANNWLGRFKIEDSGFKNKEIVICPPFILLPILKSYIINHKSSIKLGAQDVSPFPKGAYTGEVAAEQLGEFVTHVIIGHSERRQYFKESDQMLFNKVDMAVENHLEPIFCVQDVHAVIPKEVRIVAYEPIFAIGTGNPDTPKSADSVAEALKQKYSSVKYVLYGGSVTEKNVYSFTSMSNIDGVLVGGASLDPVAFSRIITNI